MVPIMCQELFGALGVKMWSEEQNLVVCVYVCEYLCVCVCVLTSWLYDPHTIVQMQRGKRSQDDPKEE
jgi:hypothetical protein